MTIKIQKLHPDAILPKYACKDDAGMDFYALETTTILPQERKTVPTGIRMAIPSGYVGLIWDKSGIALKHGMTTIGGVIDAGYRGEITILLHNLSTQPFTIEKSQKIAQMLIQPVEQKEIIEVPELDMNTQRGQGGFGSTGLR